jgi:hypothetical protein
MSNQGEAVMPGDIDLSPRSATSRIKSGNNNYKNRNTSEAQGIVPFLFAKGPEMTGSFEVYS